MQIKDNMLSRRVYWLKLLSLTRPVQFSAWPLYIS